MKRFYLLFAVILFIFSCKNISETVAKPPVPKIQEPDFSVSSIIILQAELVNTRLKVKLRIENPNPFPVSLSSLNYELYGEGSFWANGTEKNVFIVPASDFVEKDLFLMMNFIDTKRDLLDKVIAMDSVMYRFAGTVVINAMDMPILTKNFNLEGESEVTR
ncbi:MAG: LEA type 2 family protein [Treponema sp.]|nr:LEA type 2 family protein [Treponema sp.]